MFSRLFGSRRKASLAVTDAIYAQIVAAARQETLYSAWNAPDTPLGRFEMLSLHMILFLRRLRNEEPARELGQDLTDEFFRDVDHSLRELGISDMGIPKRVKKLARMFYGRVASYGEALDKADRGELAAALARNVTPERAAWPEAAAVAGYAFEASEALAAQDIEQILTGEVRFPTPAPRLGAAA